MFSINITAATEADVVLGTSPDPAVKVDGKHPRDDGLSLRTGDSISETWFKIAEEAEAEIGREICRCTSQSVEMEQEHVPDTPSIPCVTTSLLGEYEDLADEESDEPMRTTSGYSDDHVGEAAPAPMAFA